MNIFFEKEFKVLQMKKRYQRMTSIILVFIMLMTCSLYVCAESTQNETQDSRTRKVDAVNEIDENVEASKETDASFFVEETEEESETEKSDKNVTNREEIESEILDASEMETTLEDETASEEETVTETEVTVSAFSLGGAQVDGKISVDGDSGDWKNVEKRNSSDSEIDYWKVAFDENGNMYFCFGGIAASEWYGNYQWKSITFFNENGSDSRQLSGGWSIENWGGSVVFKNNAHLNSADTYFVEGMIPASYFEKNGTFAINLAGDYINFDQIQMLNDNPVEESKPEEEVYQGVKIDGNFNDWNAVSIKDVDNDVISKAAMVFDGDYVYIYLEENGDATEAGSHGNGTFAITTDLGRTLKFQLKKPDSISGVSGASTCHTGNKWEVAIPKSELPEYINNLSFGLYMQEPWIEQVSNLNGSTSNENTGVIGGNVGIEYDGSFGDWDNYPHTLIQYATAGTQEDAVDGEAALYADGSTLLGHVVTNMQAHLNEAGGEFTSAVTVRFNDEASTSFYPRFVAVDEHGNINWNPQLNGLPQGKYEFYIASLDAWGTSTNISQLNSADTMYGKITISVGGSQDEMEYYLDLEKIADKFGCDVQELKVISAQYGRIGQEWVTTAGASTLPWLILMICLILVWVHLLGALRKSKLFAWRFLFGSLGFFAILTTMLKDVLTLPLSRCVAALASLLGNLFGAYSTFFKYGIIFIATKTGSMTLQIDFECSGIIEIFAFLSLLAFFDLYNTNEKIMLGILGFSYIMICNAVRISLICFIVHYFGNSAYYVAHTFIGRIFFYILSVILYFYVFTKPQTIRMKVGQFAYGVHKTTS